MSAPSIELENLPKAVELAKKLKSIRLSISAYDPRDCKAKLKIFFRVGSGIDPVEYSTDKVLPVLRAHEQAYENELYKLGVKYGPSAENPWEKRKEIYNRISLEIQMHPEFKDYLEAIRTDKKEFTDKFENKTAISAPDFLVFHDCVKNGR
ncbi:hypothetical protein [Acetobacter orleanensis]|uniref:Uncharacterized protein n=1 Tax=Acetobacter orleanensis TaxID=104099 RepID=A0A4Y3TSZ6_9PROT|nr:hypothetical protein [Acetobacter orleanensis]KXV62565.1 hypothetical protein AD949_10680 [Acetobacter orleanensis]PCD79988.1 hypothetical protein CO710_03790 [Acetobacter orleanensis]GAN68301.1 hypothetical protein Abol_015_140 [Acetobacter orleanensis JCM 7639]GBR27580.1 hypothetical protein AA0473_1477 [Acetobacter orleanensis NRIC 0473]GEB83885.1 hypothetical protein AOR01nite_23620 [Acetobacter orleanensis]